MDEEQFELVRRWGEGLQGDPRDEVSAAGKAIVLLCAEVDRLERELWNVKTAAAAEPSGDGDAPETLTDLRDEAVETTLRERLRHAVGGLYTRPAKR